MTEAMGPTEHRYYDCVLRRLEENDRDRLVCLMYLTVKVNPLLMWNGVTCRLTWGWGYGLGLGQGFRAKTAEAAFATRVEVISTCLPCPKPPNPCPYQMDIVALFS